MAILAFYPSYYAVVNAFFDLILISVINFSLREPETVLNLSHTTLEVLASVIGAVLLILYVLHTFLGQQGRPSIQVPFGVVFFGFGVLFLIIS